MTDYRLTPLEWREHDLHMTYYAALLAACEALIAASDAPPVIVQCDDPLPF